MMRHRIAALALATAGLLATTGLTPANAEAEDLFSISAYTGASENGCVVPLWGSREPGAYVGFEPCDKSKGQTWRQISHGGGWYSYQSAASDLCLTVLNGSTAEGEDLVQQPCTYPPNQRWRFVQLDPVAVSVQWRAQHSDKCLSAGWFHHTAPSDLVQLTCVNATWQKWALLRYEPPA